MHVFVHLRPGCHFFLVFLSTFPHRVQIILHPDPLAHPEGTQQQCRFLPGLPNHVFPKEPFPAIYSQNRFSTSASSLVPAMPAMTSLIRPSCSNP